MSSLLFLERIIASEEQVKKWDNYNNNKGKYFGKMRPPPQGWNKFDVLKNREEIKLHLK